MAAAGFAQTLDTIDFSATFFAAALGGIQWRKSLAPLLLRLPVSGDALHFSAAVLRDDFQWNIESRRLILPNQPATTGQATLEPVEALQSPWCGPAKAAMINVVQRLRTVLLRAILKTMMRLSALDEELIERAKQTADTLHVHGIHEVAAALRTTSGEVFTGIHIETDVGFASVCGEVAAICCMVSAGHRDIETIVAVTSNGRGEYKLLVPCGRCRELISDFNLDAWAIVGTLEKPYKMKISDLLPLKPY